MRATDDALTSKTLFLLLQRPDGVGVALTSHDRQLHRVGTTFEPSTALGSVTFTMADNLEDCSLEIEGSLASDGIRQDDLMTGRWTDASVLLAAGDWQVDDVPRNLAGGRLRAVQQEQGRLTGKIDLLPEKLGRQPCPQTSPECRARLGDRHCRVDMRSRTLRAKVLGGDGALLTIDADQLGRFNFGSARWISGDNGGADQHILTTEGSSITLREPPPFGVRVGDTILLKEGCDGRLTTCRDRFGNVANFRGEPHLPGTDYITRYPGA